MQEKTKNVPGRVISSVKLRNVELFQTHKKNNEMEFMKSRGGMERCNDDFGQNCKNI